MAFFEGRGQGHVDREGHKSTIQIPDPFLKAAIRFFSQSSVLLNSNY